jgi:hypothetical protein
VGAHAGCCSGPALAPAGGVKSPWARTVVVGLLQAHDVGLRLGHLLQGDGAAQLRLGCCAAAAAPAAAALVPARRPPHGVAHLDDPGESVPPGQNFGGRLVRSGGRGGDSSSKVGPDRSLIVGARSARHPLPSLLRHCWGAYTATRRDQTGSPKRTWMKSPCCARPSARTLNVRTRSGGGLPPSAAPRAAAGRASGSSVRASLAGTGGGGGGGGGAAAGGAASGAPCGATAPPAPAVPPPAPAPRPPHDPQQPQRTMGCVSGKCWPDRCPRDRSRGQYGRGSRDSSRLGGVPPRWWCLGGALTMIAM